MLRIYNKSTTKKTLTNEVDPQIQQPSVKKDQTIVVSSPTANQQNQQEQIIQVKG